MPAYTVTIRALDHVWTVAGEWEPPQRASEYNDGAGWVEIEEAYIDNTYDIWCLLGPSAQRKLADAVWRELCRSM